MQQVFVRPGEPWENTSPACRTVPFGRGRHRALVRREPNAIRLMWVALPHELSDVQLADNAHLGGAGIAKVRVVRPDRYPRVTVLLAQVRDEQVDRVSHVLVA